MEPQEQALHELIQQARSNKHTLPGLDTERGVDLPSAYRIQSQDQRILKGYKLGLISPAKQQQMGISTPLYGRIYPDMLHRENISLGKFIQPRLEPEVAVVLRDAITPNTNAEGINKAIGGYFLGVDILDSVWQNYKFTAPEVVADNTSGGGFILAEKMLAKVPSGSLRLYINGTLQTEGQVSDLGNPIDRLQWLAGVTGGLEAGMIIFFGSPAAAVPAQVGTLEVADDNGNFLTARLTA